MMVMKGQSVAAPDSDCGCCGSCEQPLTFSGDPLTGSHQVSTPYGLMLDFSVASTSNIVEGTIDIGDDVSLEFGETVIDARCDDLSQTNGYGVSITSGDLTTDHLVVWTEYEAPPPYSRTLIDRVVISICSQSGGSVVTMTAYWDNGGSTESVTRTLPFPEVGSLEDIVLTLGTGVSLDSQTLSKDYAYSGEEDDPCAGTCPDVTPPPTTHGCFCVTVGEPALALFEIVGVGNQSETKHVAEWDAERSDWAYRFDRWTGMAGYNGTYAHASSGYNSTYCCPTFPGGFEHNSAAKFHKSVVITKTSIRDRAAPGGGREEETTGSVDYTMDISTTVQIKNSSTEFEGVAPAITVGYYDGTATVNTPLTGISNTPGSNFGCSKSYTWNWEANVPQTNLALSYYDGAELSGWFDS